jgi:hypothetical protein
MTWSLFKEIKAEKASLPKRQSHQRASKKVVDAFVDYHLTCERNGDPVNMWLL